MGAPSSSTEGKSSGLRMSSLFSRGESMIWVSGGALAVAVAMILGLLTLVVARGATAFWPVSLQRIETVSGGVVLGQVSETETYEPEPFVFEDLPEDVRVRAAAQVKADGGHSVRRLIRTGNRTPENQTEFVWIPAFAIKQVTEPKWALAMERTEYGPFFGEPKALLEGDVPLAEGPARAWARFGELHGDLRDTWLEAQEIAEEDLGAFDRELEDARLEVRAAEREHGADSESRLAAQVALDRTADRIAGPREQAIAKIKRMRAESGAFSLLMVQADGTEERVRLVDIVRAYPANQLGWGGRLGVYLSRWWEYLSDVPREANLEGGVWPAIFGTLVMTLLMTLLVVPFGVLGALYLREYARQGRIVSLVRIAVNNLASVPSIVFGVVGLGFFCYILGGGIDQVFFADKLPNPTYGTGGLLWASLTLSLLTLPVVVVATEEALSAVPDSMREGSYACGASKWQTIRRIVLPRAMPGVMTGMILAIARGAGEVAPLMLVGAVKMAPALPLDTTAPFIHPERSFMHLGFHIYDLGFQSPNAKAAEPLVFTTTLLLIAIVVLLNIAAIVIRGRLRATHAGS